MLVSIDYDDTFSLDPVGWFKAMEVLMKRGHKVILCTNRTDEYDWGDEVYASLAEVSGWWKGWKAAGGGAFAREAIVERTGIEVFIAGATSKRQFLANRDLFPDVWIDDHPEFVDEEGLIYGWKRANGFN